MTIEKLQKELDTWICVNDEALETLKMIVRGLVPRVMAYDELWGKIKPPVLFADDPGYSKTPFPITFRDGEWTNESEMWAVEKGTDEALYGKEWVVWSAYPYDERGRDAALDRT